MGLTSADSCRDFGQQKGWGQGASALPNPHGRAGSAATPNAPEQAVPVACLQRSDPWIDSEERLPLPWRIEASSTTTLQV